QEELLATPEDTVLHLRDAVHLRDSDARTHGEHELHVELAVDRGQVYLDRHAPTTAEAQPSMEAWYIMAAQPSASQRLTLGADLDTLNSLFQFLAFRPPEDYAGTVTLTAF